MFNSEPSFPRVSAQGDMGAFRTPHSACHLKSNHRSGLQKSCNSSNLAAPGNTKFMGSGYHLLVILFTKISGSLRILAQVLPHNTIDNTNIYIQMAAFIFPDQHMTWEKNRQLSRAELHRGLCREEHTGLPKLILSSILTLALR